MGSDTVSRFPSCSLLLPPDRAQNEILAAALFGLKSIMQLMAWKHLNVMNTDQSFFWVSSQEA